MISKQNYQRLIPSLMVATTLILSACQESGRMDAPRRAPVVETKILLGRADLTDEQKAGIFDPRQEEGYQGYLAAQIEKLSLDTHVSWEKLFALKTWILGSIESNKNINVIATTSADASSGVSDVVARQSQFEILLDKGTYQKLNTEEKAKVLLGEMLQSLFTLKNLSDADLCLLLKENLKISCQNNVDELPAKAATVKSSVSQSEHNQIIGIRNFVFSEGANLRSEDLLEKLKTAGFDLRIFELLKNEVSTPDSQEVEVSTEDSQDGKLELSTEAMAGLFADLQAMNGLKTTCLGAALDKKSDCVIGVKNSESGTDNLVQIEVEVNQENVLSEVIYNMTPGARVKKFDDQTLGVEFTTWQLTGKGLAEKKVGANYRANFMLIGINKSQDGTMAFKLEGLLSVPGTVAAVTTDKETNKSVCTGALVEAKDLKSDIIVLGSVDKYEAFVKQNISKMQKPVAPCW